MVGTLDTHVEKHKVGPLPHILYELKMDQRPAQKIQDYKNSGINTEKALWPWI